MLCVLRDSSFNALQALSPAAKWWDGQKQPPPLCMTQLELERSTTYLPLSCWICRSITKYCLARCAARTCTIPMHLHRVQVEYEFREKLILLRQHVLVAGETMNRRLWEILLRSAPSFGTLFRHALIVMGDGKQNTRGEARSDNVGRARVGFDPSAIFRFWMCAERNADAKKGDVVDLAARYWRPWKK